MAICYAGGINADQFDDLKQFIDSHLSQTEGQFEKRFEEVDAKIDGLRAEVRELRDETHDGFAGVGEAIGELHNADDDHDKRLTKLEHQTAA